MNYSQKVLQAQGTGHSLGYTLQRGEGGAGGEGGEREWEGRGRGKWGRGREGRGRWGEGGGGEILTL